MNKEEFLKELKERLEGLPSDEIENAIIILNILRMPK